MMEQDFPETTNLNEFTQLVIAAVKAVPPGKVSTYGSIARFCGKPCGARQVSRILHSCSEKYSLPWHRIINSQGKVSLTGDWGQMQMQLLLSEGIKFSKSGFISLKVFGQSLHI